MKSNVCYNLFKSPYYTQYLTHQFYFSSLFNKKRFDAKLQDFIENENSKINSKFHCEVNAKIVLAICLYKQIEKRGFYILNGCNLPISRNFTVEMVVL